jgi:transposase
LRQKVLAAALRGDRTIREHRASRIKEVAEGRGAQVLWLAPYSSDFSPIEQCWSKIKAYLRGARARTADALDKGPAQATGLVSKADIRGWFKHCGYSLARN